MEEVIIQTCSAVGQLAVKQTAEAIRNMNIVMGGLLNSHHDINRLYRESSDVQIVLDSLKVMKEQLDMCLGFVEIIKSKLRKTLGTQEHVSLGKPFPKD